jgi:hypothetical protein
LRLLDRRCAQVPILVGWYVAVGQRAGLQVFPVTTPYHTFVRYDDGAVRFNIELTEGGASFDDAVYLKGYGISSLPTRNELQRLSTRCLLAAAWAGLDRITRLGGNASQYQVTTANALALDAECLPAALAAAQDAKPAESKDRIFRTMHAVAGRWRRYAVVGDAQGDLYRQVGDEPKALRAYNEAAKATIRQDEPLFTTNLYYKIAAIHAARAKRGEALVDSVQRFNKAILACLRRDPTHQRAKELLESMGGHVGPR